MVFSSLIFLFAYLPLVLLCYYLAPRARKNTVLLIFSLLFYAWGEPIYLFLMLASIAVAFLFGRLIERCKQIDPKGARRLSVCSVCITLSFLLFFKYYPFLAENLSLFPGVHLPQFAWLTLPIGISFYTFQILSYTVDVYRGECHAQTDFVAFGTYVTLFPQLIAGPIVRYSEIDRDLCRRRETLSLFSQGVIRFSCGLAKKVLLGDMLASAYEYYKGLSQFTPTVLGAWMTVILFSLHLYYDFSGYSDMAIGLGKMFGFRFPENFNYPYVSKSITEFWRRWHVTLSTWFREYVYIPLGGNRRGKGRQYLNLAVVWLLTGFWHGASWNFLLWGAYYCILLIAEKAFLLRTLQKLPSITGHFYTLFLVVVGFLIFSYTDIEQGIRCLGALFGIGCQGFGNATVTYQLLRLFPLICIAAVGATPLPKRCLERLLSKKWCESVLVPTLCGLALLLSVAYLVDSTYSPFAYTQF